MERADISRMAFDPSKHYSSVRMQQGRVVVDDDWNENERIKDEDQRRSRVEIVGANGSPDEGFRIQDPPRIEGGFINFDILPGSFYLGGLRLELENKESYRQQEDWLGFPDHNDPAPAAERYDLVYLEAWQQSVSAVEDDELLERALGGPDTSARVRTLRRVRLKTDVQTDDCEKAWVKLKEEWKRQGLGTIDEQNLLVPNVKLTVSFENNGEPEDLCTPRRQGGYLGAENQAIRVQLIDKDHFAWGFDNASDLYRVRVSADGTGVRKIVTLLTAPKDQAHHPVSGEIVEILPWGSILPNGEKVADMVGHLSRVETSYDLDKKELTLATPIPTNLDQKWLAASNDDYFFMRVWNRGADRSSEPGIRFTNGTPVTLGRTGLQVKIEGPDRIAGDYWIIAARPETPNKVVPWELEKGVSPHGVRRFYAPLAIIDWKTELRRIRGEVVQDCRRTFPHLVDIPRSFCTIAVEPGQDIHKALIEVIRKGGGCICLLPGDHILEKPIDLSNCSGIWLRGFGSVTRLYVSDQLKGSAPFILNGSSDISFESFVVFNRTASMVWSCQRTKNLTIKNMVVSTTLVKGKQRIVSISGDQCHQWRLENNVFSGPVVIGGTLLSDSSIFGNVFQGIHRGIDLRYIQRSSVRGNRFSGLHRIVIKDHEFKIEDLRKDVNIRNLHFFNLTLRPFLPALKPEVAPDYVGIDVSALFETDIIDNHFKGSVGIDCELVENGKIHSNDFITTVTGVSCGLVHGLLFSENRIGLKAEGENKEKEVQCRLGLAILGDSINCQVVNNSFANVQEGIVFESDIGGKRAISRDFSVNLLAMKNITGDMAKQAMADSKVRIQERLDKLLLLNSNYFRVGKCEHTLIENNRFNASQTAIEWSGTKHIVDFRIANNTFIGCQDVAIQIEPDDRIFFLSDPVDTKVRLIEKNRFEVYSGAVRTTIGAVRIEKNDIRIKTPPMVFVPAIDFILAAAENVYKLVPFTGAVKANDTPMMRMVATEAFNSIEKNPGIIDKSSYSKTLENNILKKYAPQKGDVLADTSFVMKTFADIGEINFIGPLLNESVIKSQVSTEGFAVNLSGIQNRAVHNRIYSNNTRQPGGILFHVVSGEVRDNEVSVPGTALLLNGKLGLSAAYRGVEILGNSLNATGVPGDKKAVYALAIPSLSAGNIAITNNQFRGSVMVGGDPIAAQGFGKKEKYEVLDKVIHYNVVKYDMTTYTMAAVNKAFPVLAGTFGQFTLPSIVIPVWLLDPHADRPVVQFSNNRIIQGWLGIFQALSGAYWSQSLLKKQGNKALVANLNGNVIDYGGSIVGYDIIMVGNQSQLALKYRVAVARDTIVANIPKAISF